MDMLGYRQVCEKGVGWLHEMLLDDDGTKLYIIDDTDTVVVKSNDPNFPLKTAQEVWRDRKMGTSTFGCDIDGSLHNRMLYREGFGLQVL